MFSPLIQLSLFNNSLEYRFYKILRQREEFFASILTIIFLSTSTCYNNVSICGFTSWYICRLNEMLQFYFATIYIKYNSEKSNLILSNTVIYGNIGTSCIFITLQKL